MPTGKRKETHLVKSNRQIHGLALPSFKQSLLKKHKIPPRRAAGRFRLGGFCQRALPVSKRAKHYPTGGNHREKAHWLHCASCLYLFPGGA